MVHKAIWKKHGLTQARIREFFTAKDGKDKEKAEKITKRIASRWQDGFLSCLRNYKLFQAIDLAYEGTPIQKQNYPLLLWAQGKITTEALKTSVVDAQKTIEAEAKRKGDGVIKPDVLRLYEISVNLVHSYVTRRLATQTARFSNLWPYFRYEPRGTDELSKLRADVLSQRIDVMVDQFGLRRLCRQCYLHMFLYARSVLFPRSAWTLETGWRPKAVNLDIEDPDEIPTESYVKREGIDFVAPHPSRVYYDRSAPLAQVNTDNGPEWLGYWDVVPFRSIKQQDGFFNTNKVAMSDTSQGFLSAHGAFFEYYFDPALVKTMTADSFKLRNIPHDPLAENCRTANIGVYAEQEEDAGVFVNQHFEKINPKHAGICDLNQDIWFRFTVAGDGTIICAEPLPSLPAAYGGVNENDDRDVSNSMAALILPLQDQVQNLWSQMLFNLRTSQAQIWAIDKDAVDPDIVDYIERAIKSGEIYVEPKVLKYSGSALRDHGIADPASSAKSVINVIRAEMTETIETSFNAIQRLIGLIDKLLVLSPNELGQPNPREVAAREVVEISTSTNAIASFISDGIDEQRAAIKRMLFESLVCMSHSEFRVPALSRYTRRTIERAGLKTELDINGDATVPLKSPIVGRPQALVYEYLFDSRDGAERPVNSAGAEVMQQLLVGFLQIPQVAKKLGPERVFEMANEIMRLSGASFDLQFGLEDGETDEFEDSELEQRVQQIEQLLSKLIGGAQGGSLPPGATPADPNSAAPAPADRSLPAALTAEAPPADAEIVAEAGG